MLQMHYSMKLGWILKYNSLLAQHQTSRVPKPQHSRKMLRAIFSEHPFKCSTTLIRRSLKKLHYFTTPLKCCFTLFVEGFYNGCKSVFQQLQKKYSCTPFECCSTLFVERFYDAFKSVSQHLQKKCSSTPILSAS